MPRYFLLLLLCCSCATVFNKPDQEISLWTNKPTQLIVETDTLAVKTTQHLFTAKRQKNPLSIIVMGDSIQRKLELQTHDSFAYKSNYFYPHINLFLGYLIDRKADKRFAYPSIVSVDLNQNERDYYDYNVFKKAKQLLKFSPVKLFGFHNSSIELAYERPTGSDFSTQLMVSYLIPNNIYSLSADFKENTKGYRLALEERFYIKKDAPYGPYFALELDYLEKKFNAEAFFSNQDFNNEFDEETYLEYEEPFVVNTRFLSTNFKFGYQKEYDKIFVDFYFGIGRRYRTTFHEKRDNPEDHLVNNYGHFDLNYNRIKAGKSNTISIPLNLRLGWRF